MAFATITDVQVAAGGAERLRALSDTDKRNAIDTAVVQRAISRAENRVRPRIGLRYADDGGPAYRELTDMVAEEAVFILKQDRGMATEVDVAMHTERMEFAAAIGAGKATLGIADADSKSPLVTDSTGGGTSDIANRRSRFLGFS